MNDTLYAERDFASVIQSRILGGKDYPELSGWTLNVIQGSLKREAKRVKDIILGDVTVEITGWSDEKGVMSQ